jgi:hypothetical protein
MPFAHRPSRMARPALGAMRRFAIPVAIVVLFLSPYRAIAQNAASSGAGGARLQTVTVTSSSLTCPASDHEHARLLADAAFRDARFHLAGSCYLVAGDAARSNLAFLKAAAADSAATKRAMARNAAQVKAQLGQWRQAFGRVWRHPG